MSDHDRGDNESLRAEVKDLYYRATLLSPRRYLSVPLFTLFANATVIHKPGVTLVYSPGLPSSGNLIMSHSEAGAGADEFGNQYQDGDTAYRDAFDRSSPRGRMGMYVPDASESAPPDGTRHDVPPLGQFTDRARRGVVLAHEEARRRDHSCVSTGHLLVGLIALAELPAPAAGVPAPWPPVVTGVVRESAGGAGAMALASLGVSPEAARRQLAEVIGFGDPAPSGRIPFTVEATKVLELAEREARTAGRRHIGTEDILLGLLGDDDGVAARVLTGLVDDLNDARDQVIRVLDEYRQDHGHPGL